MEKDPDYRKVFFGYAALGPARHRHLFCSHCRDCFLTAFKAETIFSPCVRKEDGMERGVSCIKHPGSFKLLKFEEKHTKFLLHTKFCVEVVCSKERLLLLFRNSCFVLKFCKLSVEQGNSSRTLAISAPGLFAFFYFPLLWCHLHH